MEQEVDYQEAMNLLNGQLQAMKAEMDEVDEMSLKGDKKKMFKHMHKIYKKIVEMTERYEKSQAHGDFNSVCRELEALQPAFVLNYNEICYDSGLDMLNHHLDEMEDNLDQVEGEEHGEECEISLEKMHEIYDSLSEQVERYATSHEHGDFEAAVHQVEKLKPEFVLNYNKLTH